MANYLDNIDVIDANNNQTNVLLQDRDTLSLAQQINQRVNNLMSLGKTILYIGDSFMYGPSDLTTAINQRLKVTNSYNFSHGSTGFIRDTDGKSFPHQLQDAAADTSFNNADITDIIIAGGINDVYTNTEGDYITALDTIKSIINSNFTNAKVWLIPMLWGSSQFTLEDQRKYLRILNACINSGYAVYPNAYAIIMGLPDVMLDSVHPNTRGCDLIARNISSWIDGGIVDPEDYIVGNGQAVTGDVFSYTYMKRSGFLFCKIFLYIRNGTVSAGSPILDCDDIMKNGLDVVNTCSKAVLAGTVSGDFYIKNGKLYCTSTVETCDVHINACYPSGYLY